MRYLLIILVVLSTILYLNRAYAYFYDYQGDHFILNPMYPSVAEFKNQKDSEPIKIVTLGDSLMTGTGSTSQDKSLAFLIAKKLSSEKSVTLVNLSRPGVGVEDVLERQVPEAIIEKPQLIVLMIGINDVHNKVPENVFKKDYQAILDQLSVNTIAKISIVNIPLLGSSKILYFPWQIINKMETQKFNTIIDELAYSKSLKVIALNPIFNEQFKKSSELYSIDEFHPSDKGYALWADYINENLNH